MPQRREKTSPTAAIRSGLRGIPDRTSVADIELHGGFKSIVMTSTIVGAVGHIEAAKATIDPSPSRPGAVPHCTAAPCAGVSIETGR
jgi:hypothetical protein